MSIFADKKYFLLDLDGTLYRGNKIFPFTGKFIEALRNSGRKPIFLTNNSSKSTSQYMLKLKKLGLRVDRDEIYTSGRATIEYLSDKKLKKIFLLAAPGVEKEFTEAGFMLIKSSNLKNKHPQAVVLAFDTTFTYKKFCIAHDFIKAGVPFFATHPDAHVPLEGKKFHPDIGTFISAFYVSTGEMPKVIGKPNKHIYSQLRKHLNCSKKDMVAIGDRLYTDISGANNYNISSVLVLSGESDQKMAKNSSTKADMVIQNVGEIIPYL